MLDVGYAMCFPARRSRWRLYHGTRLQFRPIKGLGPPHPTGVMVLIDESGESAGFGLPITYRGVTRSCVSSYRLGWQQEAR